MAGTRKYKRDSKGRFAGSAGGGGGGGTFITVGKSGGFANQAFRARVAQGSARTGRGTATRLTKKVVGRSNSMARRRFTSRVLTVGAAAAGTGLARAALSGRSTKKVDRGLSLVNSNAALYGQNAGSVTNIIRRARGQI